MLSEMLVQRVHASSQDSPSSLQVRSSTCVPPKHLEAPLLSSSETLAYCTRLFRNEQLKLLSSSSMQGQKLSIIRRQLWRGCYRTPDCMSP